MLLGLFIVRTTNKVAAFGAALLFRRCLQLFMEVWTAWDLPIRLLLHLHRIRGENTLAVAFVKWWYSHSNVTYISLSLKRKSHYSGDLPSWYLVMLLNHCELKNRFGKERPLFPFKQFWSFIWFNRTHSISAYPRWGRFCGLVPDPDSHKFAPDHRLVAFDLLHIWRGLIPPLPL